VNVDLFDFELPPERIALRPASRAIPRGCWCSTARHARRLRARPAVGLLQGRPARVQRHARHSRAARRGLRRRMSARIGATLHKREGPRRWRAFIRNAKRLREGDSVDFGQGVTALASDRAEDGSFALDFAGDEPVELLLERCGRMPLPPYIASKRPTDARDADDYQTMFASEPGAVAAPTAALHFTPDLLAALDAAGIGHATLTLHVGAGTFLPVKAEDTEHKMHAEWGRIDAAPPIGSTRSAPPAAGDRGRHHQPAPDRERRGRGRRDPAVRRRHCNLHYPGLSLQGESMASSPISICRARRCSCWYRR
jgi:S-adenosylmethionine:tRNA ribosyltransferase-isomerase